MTMVQQTTEYFDRKSLTRQAIRESINARKLANCDLVSPVNVYDVCEKHGVTVRFTPINMEGMYDRSSRPRIHISALRPLVRRNLTCAHELGHHVFGHGSTIDELTEQAGISDYNNPIEFLANQFAYNLMMPALGVRNAFSSRDIDPAEASPSEMFRISSHFSVGYTTLLSHLRYGLNILPTSRYELLMKTTPKSIRKAVLQQDVRSPLVIVDNRWGAHTIDLESGDYVLMNATLDESTGVVEFVSENAQGKIYRALRQGIQRIKLPEQDRFSFVRVSKTRVVDGVEVGYVGLAQYRHMGDDDGA